MVLNFPTSPINGQVSNDFYFDSSVGTEGAWRSSPVPIGGLPAGSIIQWAGATAPANWLIADGSAVSRTTYPSLFNAIGVTYGTGDGSTTFNLPDLRGRVAVGKNGGTFGTLGATGGAETHTLTHANTGWQTTLEAPLSGYGLTTAAPFQDRVAVTIPGGATAHNNLQPYLVTNYIIKATSGWSAGDSELAQRVGVLEAAPAGLVRVVPTSVAVGSGSASVSASGVVTFTGASSVSLNGCFNGTFDNYRMVFQCQGSSDGAAVYFRFRTSSDYSGNLYFYNGMYARATGAAINPWSAGPVAQFDISRIRNLSEMRNFTTMDINNPYKASVQSNVTWSTQALDTTSYINITASGSCEQQTQYTGLTVFASAGTMTGIMQVYGYRN